MMRINGYSYNEFNKKMNALKKYCPMAYKDLIFNIKNNHKLDKEDGNYLIDLKTSKEFKMLYGQIKLFYEIKNGKIKFKNIEPSDFFSDGYEIELKPYKNYYCRNNADKFKIDLLEEMKKEEKK